MIFFSRLFILIIFHLAIILPAKLELSTPIKSTRINSLRITDNQESVTSRQMDLDNMNDSIFVLCMENFCVEDFENGANGWSLDFGWELTESNMDCPSPTHSVFSPNSDNNQGGVYNLLTPVLELPEIGIDETMHFGFYLYVDMPDSDGDDDNYLDDYYSISILDKSEESA